MVTSNLQVAFLLLSLAALPYGIASKCNPPLDVVQVQETTSFFGGSRLESMKDQVAAAMKTIKEFNSQSFFGFASFKDKPLSGVRPQMYIGTPPEGATSEGTAMKLGEATDYCVRIDRELSVPDATAVTQILSGHGSATTACGGDWLGNSLGALYRTIVSSKAKWRQTAEGGEKVNRLAIVVTNSAPHEQGEISFIPGIRPFDITVNGMNANGGDESYDCAKVDYPSLKQVADLIKENDITVAFLVAPGGKYDAQGAFVSDNALVGENYGGEAGLAKYYTDMLEEAGLTKFLVVPLASDLSNYADAVERATVAVRDSLCATGLLPVTQVGFLQGEHTPKPDCDESDKHDDHPADCDCDCASKACSCCGHSEVVVKVEVSVDK